MILRMLVVFLFLAQGSVQAQTLRIYHIDVEQGESSAHQI